MKETIDEFVNRLEPPAEVGTVCTIFNVRDQLYDGVWARYEKTLIEGIDQAHHPKHEAPYKRDLHIVQQLRSMEKEHGKLALVKDEQARNVYIIIQDQKSA